MPGRSRRRAEVNKAVRHDERHENESASWVLAAVRLADATCDPEVLVRPRFAATPGGEMEIKRSGSQPSAKGPAEWFTGTVCIDPLFDAPVPARAAGASVTFEPGARTAWHTIRSARR